MKQTRIRQLAALAALRQDRAAARLARKQTVVSRLSEQLAPLQQATPNTGGDIAMRAIFDRHEAWRLQELSKVTLQLAQARAEAQPEREAHARETARKNVLEELARGKHAPRR